FLGHAEARSLTRKSADLKVRHYTKVPAWESGRYNCSGALSFLRLSWQSSASPENPKQIPSPALRCFIAEPNGTDLKRRIVRSCKPRGPAVPPAENLP